MLVSGREIFRGVLVMSPMIPLQAWLEQLPVEYPGHGDQPDQLRPPFFVSFFK